MPEDLTTSKNALSTAWENQAENWVRWAREPGHDSYWRFHRDLFFRIVPPPGKLTVDIGCGEGRLPRDLKKLGHKVIGVDASPTMIKYAREADPTGEYHVANAAKLPFENASCDLTVAFMSLQDVDDLDNAVAEIERVLVPGGRACIAIVHPINSAGHFVDESPNSKFEIEGSYLTEFNYDDTFSRDGLEMTFYSKHRTVESYSQTFERNHLLIEAIREVGIPEGTPNEHERSKRWARLPLFLHFRLLKRG